MRTFPGHLRQARQRSQTNPQTGVSTLRQAVHNLRERTGALIGVWQRAFSEAVSSLVYYSAFC